MHRDLSANPGKEKRGESRAVKLRNHRVEIKMAGEPIYQFKVSDVSTQGAGLLINESSHFLKLIEVGQVLDVNFISPQGSEPAGMYKAKIRHITEMGNSRYKGVRLIGVRILEHLAEP